MEPIVDTNPEPAAPAAPAQPAPEQTASYLGRYTADEMPDVVRTALRESGFEIEDNVPVFGPGGMFSDPEAAVRLVNAIGWKPPHPSQPEPNPEAQAEPEATALPESAPPSPKAEAQTEGQQGTTPDASPIMEAFKAAGFEDAVAFDEAAVLGKVDDAAIERLEKAGIPSELVRTYVDRTATAAQVNAIAAACEVNPGLKDAIQAGVSRVESLIKSIDTAVPESQRESIRGMLANQDQFLIAIRSLSTMNQPTDQPTSTPNGQPAAQPQRLPSIEVSKASPDDPREAVRLAEKALMGDSESMEALRAIGRDRDAYERMRNIVARGGR